MVYTYINRSCIVCKQVHHCFIKQEQHGFINKSNIILYIKIAAYFISRSSMALGTVAA
jgi:hypothetical protein